MTTTVAEAVADDDRKAVVPLIIFGLVALVAALTVSLLANHFQAPGSAAQPPCHCT